MAISDRIESIEEHLRDDYSVLEVAGADLTNVDKNILNLKPTWQERLLYFMNNGTQQVWDNWDKVTGEGTSITLDNTEEAPMKIVLKGNTSQEGTPTPETPQDIHVVSGDNSIEVKGKNLLKNKATNQTINGVVFTVYDDGSVKAEGKATANTALPITGANNVFVDLGLQNGTYRLSGATGGAQNTWAIYMAIKHSDNITTTLYNTNGDLAFTKATGDTFFSVVRIENGTTVNQMFYPMIRVSSVLDDTYTPYESNSYPISLGNIELLKIGTYQDKIFKNTPNTTDYNSELEDNVWYVKKEIGKLDLSSIPYWSRNTNGDFYLEGFSSSYGYISGQGLSNVFKYSTTTWVINCFGINSAGVLWISTKDETLTTSAEFTTYLTNKNALMYGVLATPTYTEITDSTLLSQLEAVKRSYDGQTNITQTNTDLPFILDATALREMT